MDYKTDRVAAPEELITRYATQLQLYGQALSRVFSKAEGPKLKTENLIYSFALDRVIPVQEDGKTEII
jgi:ATP-dependent helicase/nuclease subunit A